MRMSRQYLILPVLIGLVGAIVAGCTEKSESERSTAPIWNIVLVLVDDLGWTDLGIMGSSFYQTPNIDRLAREGMRFTNAYAAATVCSPTRASILTGQYPARLHVTDWIHGHARPWAKLQVPTWTHELPSEVTTLAEALGTGGYVSASIGKWHLGGDFPEAHGFDLNVAGDHRGQPPSYYAPYNIPTLPELENDEEYLTDRLTDEAIAFITRNRTNPFFLYLPFYTVHTPIEPPLEKLTRYEAKAATLNADTSSQRNPGYAGMIESLDDGVGRLLETLNDLDIADRTVVIFASDNGGLVRDASPWGPVTSNLGLRAGKGSSYEGGIRVPFIVKWPSTVQPGTVESTPIISPDIYSTILEIAGLGRNSPELQDGISLVPLLKGAGPIDREALYWHYPHYHPGGATPHGAVRVGDLKLIEFYEDARVELYDLGLDASETQNLAIRYPSQAKHLTDMLHVWRDNVGAQMPLENPDFDVERALEFTH